MFNTLYNIFFSDEKDKENKPFNIVVSTGATEIKVLASSSVCFVPQRYRTSCDYANLVCHSCSSQSFKIYYSPSLDQDIYICFECGEDYESSAYESDIYET